MIPSPRRRGVRAAGFVLAVLLAVLALPLVALAHAELESVSPPDGAVLSEPPTEVVLTFSAELNTSKSSVTLRDPAGTEIAKGGVDPADDTVMRLIPAASLAPGTYEVRWTSVALDGDLLRGTLHFDLTAPTPSPTATPTAAPSATASPPPAPSSSPSPAPSATPGSTSGSGDDVILPIIVALIVILLLGMFLLRGRSRGGGGA